MHMLKLWVAAAASNMRQGKMVLWTGSMVTLQSDCSGWMAYLAGAVLLGAEEAWPRSTQTRSLLLTKLRGKSSCNWAESASLLAEVWFLSTGHLQQQSYAMSVFATPTERGSLS